MSAVSIAQTEAVITYPALVGKVLIAQREFKGLTQGALASLIGLSQPAYSRLEAGESALSVTQLHKLAEVFGVPTASLLAQADQLEFQMTASGVKVLHEKPDNPAALAIGLGLLAALILSAKK